ncbi:MAG: LacI family DNA-binding transcriptional regulator [Bryobacteraceae bacterium]
MITIADIGRELGISAMTVSRALNGHRAVSPETRQRVLSYAERSKYRPNRLARSLVTRKSHIVGIIIPDISHTFFSEVTRAVQDALELQGYDLMLCHTHGSIEREAAAIEMLLCSKVDGLIVASSRPETAPGIFADLQRESTPFVLLDRFFANLDCAHAGTDDVLVGRLAAQHLIDLGHRAIGYIGGPQISVARQRFEGFCAVMAENRLHLRPQWVKGGKFDMDSGCLAMQQMLALPHRPTAVFAANDPAAIGAIRACREAGLVVPQQMSIVGAGSIEASFYPSPFLTTIDWSRKELGETAAAMLLDAINGVAVQGKTILPHLLIRQSTAPLL